MLLRNSLGRPRAAEWSRLSWEETAQRFRDIFLSGGEYDTGIRGAEQLSPVAAAHRILCNDFGMIPFSLYRKDGDARVPAHDHWIDRVFKARPNDNMTPYMLGRTVMSNAFWHGFGAVWNRRDGSGRIVERVPLPAECCHIRRDPETGQYFYDYSVDGVSRSFTGYELSFLFFESYDGIRGRGLLDLARETIGAEGAAQQYGRKFYQNGAMISGIVEVDADLNREARERVKKQFASYNPYGDDAFKVAVLTRGYKYTPIGLKQADAQYIESRAFSVEEVSRFTGIPKHMLQSGKESYESNAQQRVVFVQDTLAPYVVQWEQENSFKCLLSLQRAEGMYFKGNLSVLMRGDDQSRAEFYAKMVEHGIMNPDECRGLEERNPIPGGLGGQFLATKNLGSLESILRGETDNG